MNDLTTVQNVARQLSISPKRVYQLIQDGQLDSLRITARSIRVTRSSVEKFIEERMKQEKKELGLDIGRLPTRKRIQ